MLTDTVILT